MSIAEPPKQPHLLHLFYQVQIRLGSPPSSPRCCCYLQPNSSHCFTTPRHPAPRIGTSRKFMRQEHYGNFSVADSAARVPPEVAAGVGRMHSAVLYAGIPGPDRKVAYLGYLTSGIPMEPKMAAYIRLTLASLGFCAVFRGKIFQGQNKNRYQPNSPPPRCRSRRPSACRDARYGRRCGGMAEGPGDRLAAQPPCAFSWRQIDSRRRIRRGQPDRGSMRYR